MKKHTPEQVVDKLRRVEALVAGGATVATAVREIEVPEQTYYRWKRQYGGVDKSFLRAPGSVGSVAPPTAPSSVEP